MELSDFRLKQIGVIRTPYKDRAPFQPVNGAEGEFRIEVDPTYEAGLMRLEDFRYIYVLFFLNGMDREVSMISSPPWVEGLRTGIFASRSPARPNPIGLSIVQVYRIIGNEIIISGMDAFDGTPLLDIKPYIKDLDSKEDANYGWLTDAGDREHLMLHIKGIPHDY